LDVGWAADAPFPVAVRELSFDYAVFRLQALTSAAALAYGAV
jgi:hypothetical protein